MAVAANFSSPDREKFKHCYGRLISFTYRDEDSVRTDLNILLDELNSIEYSIAIVCEEDGNKLVARLCSVVPLYEERLVVKVCQIITVWKRRQMLVLKDQTLVYVMDYLINALQRCQTWARPDILRTLGTVLYEQCDRVVQFHDALVGKNGVLIQLINDTVSDCDTLKTAVQCLECLSIRPSSTSEYLTPACAHTIYNVFVMLLHRIPTTKLDQLYQCNILMNSLRGIQNIIQGLKTVPEPSKLGVLLASVRTYMFYGLYNQPVVVPESLYPTPLSHIEVGKVASSSPSADEEKTAKSEGQKKSKKRRSKKPTKDKSDKGEDESRSGDNLDTGQGQQQGHEDEGQTTCEGHQSINTSGRGKPEDDLPAWSKISSSESEWSDTEGGQTSRLRSNCTKVRQCALSCFYWIVKHTDKRVMFGYWSSFIPDTQGGATMAGAQTLFTIILKDPAAKPASVTVQAGLCQSQSEPKLLVFSRTGSYIFQCRMGALAALSMMVDGTKPLLSAAEESDDTKTATFTPFSMILGSTVKELHRCLLLAMVSEDYPITLTQLIKCFGTVIANVPYHRMRPGLLSRIVKQIRNFINHRDPNVRVACLTCLGSMAGIQPPLMEVSHIIQPPKPPVSTRSEPPDQSYVRTDPMSGKPSNQNIAKEQDSGFNSSSPLAASPGGAHHDHSGGTTPKKSTSSSGLQTPVFSDQLLQAHARDISWVVKLCVRNILPQSTPETVFGSEELYFEPLPVRLESLQTLANLTKGYFPIIRNCVPLLKELIHKCYYDSDPVVKLHTAKLLDEFSQVLLQDLQTKDDKVPNPEKLDRQQVIEFWMSLLNGPIPDILQNRSHGAVRATTCDCIANIGDEMFTSLPIDKRIMCLTITLGLANDDDKLIRASALRTLGVYVMYKSLREDVSFVSDVTCAILSGMEDKAVAVRVKGAWSLANLCDALALNREDGDTDFMEDFSEVMLLNVVTTATKACQDSDKVKANGVRSLGNIMRYLSAKNISKESFSQAIATGVKALVKCVGSGAMKVRWNACYALSNMFKNLDVPTGTATWSADIINALCSAVKDCKNFKVRINAALALTTPKQRCQYGNSAMYSVVWRGLVGALGTAEDISDYIDFRYRDTLTDQICVGILHLVSLLQVEDIVTISQILEKDGELLASCLDKYYTTRQPESQMDVYLDKAKTQLETLSSQKLTDSQQSCVNILQEISQRLFTAENIDVEKPPQKTAFVQTYD